MHNLQYNDQYRMGAMQYCILVNNFNQLSGTELLPTDFYRLIFTEKDLETIFFT